MFFGVALIVTSIVLSAVIFAGTWGFGTPVAIGIGVGGVAAGAGSFYSGYRFFNSGSNQGLGDMTERFERVARDLHQNVS